MAVEMDGASKGILGAFAVFTLGSGIASLIYGVLLLLRYIAIDYNYGIFSLFATSIVLIAVGGLLIITVVLGVIGALREAANLRMITLVLTFLLFIVLAVIGVWGMVIFKTGRLQRSIDLDIENLNKNFDDLSPELKNKSLYLNQHYKCCGWNAAFSDTNANAQGKPERCCITPGCGQNPSKNEGDYFQKSCGDVYFQTKSNTVFQLAILTLAAAGAALLGLILYAVVFQKRAHAGYAGVSRG